MPSHLTRMNLGDLSLFRVIAETGGFRRAAAELDLSPSAVSHAMRGLEQRLGVRLFNRTSRSVTLTAAGESLLAETQAGLDMIKRGLEALNQYRERPAGHLRINVPRDAARLILAPMLADYAAACPDVRLEVEIDDKMVDIVEKGFDAGIRYGGGIAEDMIALPLCPPLRWITVAAPSYLANAAKLDKPDDLASHKCLGMRMGNGRIYHWELERAGEVYTLNTDWLAVANETDLQLEMARKGAGICYTLERRVSEDLANGALVEVLPEWASVGPAFFLYYPSRRQLPEALRVLVHMIQTSYS